MIPHASQPKRQNIKYKQYGKNFKKYFENGLHKNFFFFFLNKNTLVLIAKLMIGGVSRWHNFDIEINLGEKNQKIQEH